MICKCFHAVFLMLIFFFSAVAASDDDNVILLAYNIVKSLGKIKDERCVTYSMDIIRKSLYYVSVRESHEKNICFGDGYTSPKMYDVLIDYEARLYFVNGYAFKNKRCYLDAESDGGKGVDAIIVSQRSPLFAGPADVCKINNLYLVKGDSVSVVGENNGFYHVIYESKRFGTFSAWIVKENSMIH